MQIPSHIIAQKNLIKLKEAYGLSYTTISKQSGMDLGYIQRLFSGNRSLGFKNLDRFARFFSIASHDLKYFLFISRHFTPLLIYELFYLFR